MDNDNLVRLRRVFHETFNIEPSSVVEETVQNDIPQWDSLGHLRLMMAVEKEFKVKLQTSTITQIQTVEALLHALEA